MEKKPKTRRIGMIAGIIVIGAVAFLAIRFWTTPKEKEFHLVKPWREPGDSSGKLSEGFLWLHRQCHDHLVDTDHDGQITKRLASEVNRIGPRTWTFRIAPTAKWNDDGTSVTADDFVQAWNMRAGKINDPNFLRIKKISAEKSTAKDVLNNDLLTVELGDTEDHTLDMAALASPWLTALKQKKDANWSWDKELSAPCDGPFVAQRNKDVMTLTRNKYWRDYRPEFISIIKVTLDTDYSAKVQARADLFKKGSLSFVGGDSEDSEITDTKVMFGRGLLESRAYYILTNPKGRLSGALMALPHFSVNRSELAALALGSDRLYTMYRVLPLSLLNRDASGSLETLPPQNYESVQRARQLLGIKDDSLAVSEIKPPFKGKIKIYYPENNEAIAQMAQRLGQRLLADYNMPWEDASMRPGAKPPGDWDLLFVSVDLKDGVPGWAGQMTGLIETHTPSQTELISKFRNLAQDRSSRKLNARSLTIVNEIDALAPKKTALMALGQFGKEYLLESGIIDVVLTGRGDLDPDISRARRIKLESKP